MTVSCETHHAAGPAACQPNSVRVIGGMALACLCAATVLRLAREYAAHRERMFTADAVISHLPRPTVEAYFRSNVAGWLKQNRSADCFSRGSSFRCGRAVDTAAVNNAGSIGNVVKYLLFIKGAVKAAIWQNRAGKLEDFQNKVFTGGASAGHVESSFCCCGRHSVDGAGGGSNAPASKSADG